MEIHFGEGGQDSKLFISDLFSAYTRYAEINKLKIEILDTSEGHVVAKVVGKGVWEAFKREGGQHVVQRVPPTERSGRRQTSMISVAVLPLPPEKHYQPLPEKELTILFQTSGGPGGQHRNKSATAVRMKHEPTGLHVFINSERNQSQNRHEALRILTAKVNAIKNQKLLEAYGSLKKGQLGTGGRGNKIRTYNFIQNFAKDHITGAKTSKLSAVMSGRFDLLR